MTPTFHYLAHVFGWTLLHLCWQGAVIALLLGCALSLLAKGSPQLRYAVSCGALLLILVTLVITFQRVAFNVKHLRTSSVTFTSIIGAHAEQISQGTDFHFNTIEKTLEQSLPYVLFLWSAGFFLCLARLNIGLFVASHMASTAALTVSAEQIQLFHCLAHRFGITRSIKLLRSTAVQVPVVIGWLRPVVLLPVGSLLDLSLAQIEAIFAHELAHIRRHDYIVSILQSVVEALLFYHPGVWWISKQIRKERELCCDDVAVKVVGDPVVYARALYLLAEHRSALPAIILSANGGFLTMRIKRLLYPNDVPVTPPSIAITAFALTLVVAAVGFGTAQAERPVPIDNTRTTTKPIILSKVQPIINIIPIDTPRSMLAKIASPLQPSIHAADLQDARSTFSAGQASPSNPQALCTIQVVGNRHISTESVIAHLLSHEGDIFDPSLIERDFNSLWNTGYFDDLRIEKQNKPSCTQLIVSVRERAESH